MAADGQIQPNIGGEQAQAPGEAGVRGAGIHAQEAELGVSAVLQQVQLSMRLQLAESEERKAAEARRLEKEKADLAKREHEEMLSALTSLTRGLKDLGGRYSFV